MDESQRILHVIGLTYEAGADPARWPETLGELAALLNSSGATLLFGDAVSAAAGIVASVGIETGDLARYNDYYVQHDLRLQEALVRPVGAVMTNEMVVPGSSFARTEFFSDFLRPLDLPYILGVVLMREQGAFSSLGIHRGRTRGEFTDHECRLHARLIPHLQRALAIHRRMSEARTLAAAGGEALDQLATGVLVFDDRGRLLLANRAAREILDARDGLVLRDGRLYAATPALTRALEQLLRGAVAGAGPATGGALGLPRTSGRRPLAVIAAPLRVAPPTLLAAAGTVALFVSDPDRAGLGTAHHLRRLYGLTAAESELAARLVEGRTLKEAAAELQISPLTARTQLKAVFQKTDTNRQTELVRVVMRSLGQIRRERGDGPGLRPRAHTD